MSREDWWVIGLIGFMVVVVAVISAGAILWPDLGQPEPRTVVCWSYPDGLICKTWPGGLITTP